MAKTAASADDKRKLPKLVLPMTADRRVALDKTSERNRERLRLVMSDPQLRADLQLPADVAAAPAPPAADGFPLKYTDPILQILSTLAAVIAGKLGETTGWFDGDALIPLVVFNTAERRELAQPVADAIDYNWPGLVTTANPNVALALAVGAIVQKKLAALQPPAPPASTGTVQ